MSLALRSFAPSVFTRLQVPVQVALYAGIFIISDQLVSVFHLPLPANIVGMLLLLVMIMLRILPVRWVQAGSRWLLAEMLLFFVPAVVAVVNYAQLIMVDGWKIFVVIAVSTSLTLAATGLVVDRVYRFEVWLQRRKSNHHE
ncbi:TPA: CidA/LrgA family protein [Yersinia enterocolitica]|uniref:CidA/LrgA family protein n=1 Tax=Yersinia enterocolitica TaxID=630 RepID=UPI00094BA043|nr:CidA/LrgA family protein [Yersinia enterocolitica]MBW5835611.1 CidA/LrgA family protein [Yersinia enterocolitica]MBX9474217.1 CidA/LrgA family protein [Yersinia enterocolitica]MBX9486208.1 CidA/LrgA family protein [Yersinia enterocolitica]MBX9490477.1 CidA/LrgA family protein [Yersinia enterocolitica]HDL8055573.1 CidA/LrgA family protein [Yersinia enterocolitica]